MNHLFVDGTCWPFVQRGSRAALGLACLGLACLVSIVVAEPATRESGGQAADRVAATVDGEAIEVSEVEEALAAALAGRRASAEVQALGRAQSLEALIDQRLLGLACRRRGIAVSDADMARQLQRMEQPLAARGTTLEAWLAERGLRRDVLEKRLSRSVAIEKYLATQTTEENLATYFESHRREFDGSLQHARHLVLRPDAENTPQALRTLYEQATQLRQRIVSGELTFAEAAERYSAGPSRRRGGDIGKLERHGLQAESFAAAAFLLSPGEISPPVVTPVGIHLIQCVDTEPGKLGLAEVREAMTPKFAEQILKQLAADERATTSIEYTGVVPYFRPGTRELVLPVGH